MSFNGLTSLRRIVVAYSNKTFETYILTFGDKILGCIPSEKVCAFSWVESAVLDDLRHILVEKGVISEDARPFEGALQPVDRPDRVVKRGKKSDDKDRLF